MEFLYYSPQLLGSAFTSETCNRFVSKKINERFKYLYNVLYIYDARNEQNERSSFEIHEEGGRRGHSSTIFSGCSGTEEIDFLHSIQSP